MAVRKRTWRNKSGSISERWEARWQAPNGKVRTRLCKSKTAATRAERALKANSVKAETTFEAGSTSSRRTLGWHAPTASPNTSILYNLTTLRDRSRAAVRNNGYAKGAIDRLVSNIVGTGITPLSQAADPTFRQEIQSRWLKWTYESDADGVLEWEGQQAQAVRAWLEGGEVFVRIRHRRPEDGLSVPFQLQILEPELCPHIHNTINPRTGNKIRAGIEIDKIGRRVAYWFHPSRPMDFSDYDASRLVPIAADMIIHMYDAAGSRPGQLRGVPHLTQALIRLHEVDKYDDATLLRQQLSNLFTAFLTRPLSVGDGDILHPLTGQGMEEYDEKQVLSLEPGIFQELAPGEEIKFSDPPEVGTGYADFLRQQLFHICAAAGVPYEVLTGDMSKVNDRTVRVILNEFRRQVEAWQHNIVAAQLCRPIWLAWLDRGWTTATLPIPEGFRENPEPWTKVKWMPEGWQYIHPVQDVQAHREAIRAGLTSRSAVVSELGEDAEAIDREQSADNERADELGLKYDSDGRSGKSISNSTQPPDSKDDEEGEEEDEEAT